MATDLTFLPTSFDAFGRLRVSDPLTLFDSKQIFDNLPLKFDEATTGAGSTSHSTDTAATTLTVAGTGSVIRQSKQYFSYQPGKSFLVYRTFSGMGQEAGVTKRYGYFDDNNGVFLQVDDSGVSFVIRSHVTGSPVDTTVEQADWNGDRLNILVTSDSDDIGLDTDKAQIVWFDFEWLGVGTVRCGFVIDGKFILCHTFYHANEISNVYMSTPNLPLRSEVISTGGASGSFDEICSSVISEGGYQITQSERTIDRGATAVSISATDPVPVIALRIKSAYKGATFSPAAAKILCTSGATFRWLLCLNPTITGTAFSWTSLANSAIEYDNTLTQATTITDEGYLIESDYAEVSNNPGEAIRIGDSFLRPGFDIAGNSDIIVLAVQKIAGGNETFHASLKFVEVY